MLTTLYQNTPDTNDLPPKVEVFKHKKENRGPDPVLLDIEYSDEVVRVIKTYDIGATPWQGQWNIRIDIYE